METSIVTHSLKELRMPGMAECLKSMEEPHQLDKLSVRDGMQLLIQAEISNRETNRVARLIKKASFRINASMDELYLLIIDDFGMKTIEGQQQNDFEQIIDDRYGRKSTIISTQLPVSDWYALFKNELIAEACLDRIVHKAVRFQLQGESLRKKY